MIAYKKILCPTDFSPPSFEAVKTAVELARHFGAELWVVHVIPPVPPPAPVADSTFGLSFDLPLYQPELADSSEKALNDLMEQRVSKDVGAHPLLASGNPAREIIRAAEENKIDLIVIATHGLTGWGRLLFGSVAEKVVRLAPCEGTGVNVGTGEVGMMVGIGVEVKVGVDSFVAVAVRVGSEVSVGLATNV